MIGPTNWKNWLTFSTALVPYVDSRSIFLTIADCRWFISISHSHQPIFLQNLAKWMNPQHFGRDPADIWIWIYPTVQIEIPDNLWLKFWHWWSEYSLVVVMLLMCCWCRLLVSGRLQKEAEFYASFVEGERTVKEFCQQASWVPSSITCWDIPLKFKNPV